MNAKAPQMRTGGRSSRRFHHIRSSPEPPVSSLHANTPEPDKSLATLQAVWRDTIAHSARLEAYAAKNGALFGPASGDEAQTLAFPAVQANAWQLFNSGKAKVSPATVGIPAPPA